MPDACPLPHCMMPASWLAWHGTADMSPAGGGDGLPRRRCWQRQPTPPPPSSCSALGAALPLHQPTVHSFPFLICCAPPPPFCSIYLFMASIATLLTIWAWLLVPETNRVPIERLQATFAAHWVWHRFFPKTDVEKPAVAEGGKLDLKVGGGSLGQGRWHCHTLGHRPAAAQRCRFVTVARRQACRHRHHTLLHMELRFPDVPLHQCPKGHPPSSSCPPAPHPNTTPSPDAGWHRLQPGGRHGGRRGARCEGVTNF